MAADSGVLTWQRFRVFEWLERKAPPYGAFIGCPNRQPPFEVPADFLAIALAKGTAIVDDIRITEATQSHIDFDPAQRCLLIGIDCPVEFLLLWGVNSVFTLSTDNEISIPSYNDRLAPFVKELTALRTKTALLGRIARHDKK